MSKIIELHYNYSPACSDSRDNYPDTWTTETVGKNNVTEITEHGAAGEGDKWYYDIFFEDGTMHRIFNPCKVIFAP